MIDGIKQLAAGMIISAFCVTMLFAVIVVIGSTVKIGSDILCKSIGFCINEDATSPRSNMDR